MTRCDEFILRQMKLIEIARTANSLTDKETMSLVAVVAPTLRSKYFEKIVAGYFEEPLRYLGEQARFVKRIKM